MSIVVDAPACVALAMTSKLSVAAAAFVVTIAVNLEIRGRRHLRHGLQF